MTTPPTIDELVARAATGDRALMLKAVERLVRVAGTGPRMVAAFHLLAGTPGGGRRAVEFLARLPEPVPAALVEPATPLLADRGVPVPVRVAAAGKLLAVVPDTPAGITPVVRAVTNGLSKSRTLDRLLMLQSRVEKCDALDRAVEAADRRVKLKCPKCGGKYGRAAFVKHLWHTHRLTYDHGHARDPRTLVEAAVTAAVRPADPAAVDAVFQTTTHAFPTTTTPKQVFQAVAARGVIDPSRLAGLLESAAEQRCGLCPACLNAVPDPLPALPPPLPLGGGRLAGDGYVIAVTDGHGGTRKVTAETPAGPLDIAAGQRFSPAAAGVWAAAGVFAVGLLAVSAVPSRLIAPGWVALWLAAVGWFAYFAVRLLRGELPPADATAIDLAWTEMVPTVGKSKRAAKFVTRLCRTSPRAGQPAERMGVVWKQAEATADLAEKGGVYLQKLAALRVLQACDGAKLGRDRATALVGVFEPVFRGELPLVYAEAAAETLTTDANIGPGEASRAAVLVIAAAFDAGYTPGELSALGRCSPLVAAALDAADPDRLAALQLVWKGRHSKPWAAVGDADDVFELARRQPAESRRLLADYPDLLLRLVIPAAVEREFGPALLCSRGLALGDRMTADPDAVIEQTRSANGSGWYLKLGRHSLTAGRKLPPGLPGLLQSWLRYRIDRLLPPARPPVPLSDKAVRLLSPLAVLCPLCGTAVVCRAGRRGATWADVAAGVG